VPRDGLNIPEELLKDVLEEVTSLALPGLRIALRFVVLYTRNNDPMKGALEAALMYQFTIEPQALQDGPAKPVVTENRWRRLRSGRRRKKVEREARSEARDLVVRQGLDLSGLLAAIAATRSEDGTPMDGDIVPQGVLIPLRIVQSELSHAIKPILPPSEGWRQHVAEALTAAATTGLTSADPARRQRWEELMKYSLGVTGSFAERAPDWGRLVGAALEYEIRKAENARLALSAQLDRADVSAQAQKLAETAAVSQRSLSRLVLFVGVLSLTAVVATAFFGVSLIT
jgi:hypothetical protein